jgi:hypothetical protein
MWYIYCIYTTYTYALQTVTNRLFITYWYIDKEYKICYKRILTHGLPNRMAHT